MCLSILVLESGPIQAPLSRDYARSISPRLVLGRRRMRFRNFSPTSVQFKGETNGARLCKRHQKRHLEFCTAYLLSRGSPVRVWPGAPLSPSVSSSYRPLSVALALDASHCHDFVTHRVPGVFFGSLVRGALVPDEPDPADRRVSVFYGCYRTQLEIIF